jgi:outer membrane protein assembly factor BamB
MRPTTALFSTLLACPACGPQPPEETAAGDPSGSSTDGSIGSTGTTDPPDPTGVPTSGDPTTGAPIACLEGQASLTPLWSANIPQSNDPEVFAGRWLDVLGDGRIVVEGRTHLGKRAAPGVFLLPPQGAPAVWNHGPLADVLIYNVVAARVAADDTIVLVGSYSTETTKTPFLARFGADGTELARLDIQTANLNDPEDFELRGDALVVTGFRTPDHRHWLARVDLTGAVAWEVELPGKDIETPRHLALGPAGELVVGHGLWPNDGDPEYKVWRVGPDGQLVWERDLVAPTNNDNVLTDLVVTPDGTVVSVTTAIAPNGKVALDALALSDGADLWKLDVAVADDFGDPYVRGVLVDPDALTLPIAMSPDYFEDGTADPLAVFVHRVSFTGEHLGAAQLDLPGVNGLFPSFAPARGACGELLLFQEDPETPWLAAFAP